jgi:peptide/nickel transport system substrate-binding protein
VAAGHDQDYGGFISATGPYMFKGADQIDYSKPAADQSPASGYQAGKSYVLVRNPSWDPSTDPLRKAYVDEIDATVGGTTDDLQNKIEAGELDTMDALPNPKGIRDFSTNPDLKGLMHADPTFGTYYINMNLAMPPFDDIHVRKAMNFIIDKPSLIKAWGGPTIGKIANHIVPDTLFNNQLAEFVPYKTAGDHGDVAKAKAAMKGSKYSNGSSGMCDVAACKNVLLLSDTRGVDPGMVATIQQDAKKIGITFKVRQINGAYPTLQTPSNNIPISERPGWGKDYADALTFFTPLFDGRTLIPNGNTNYSLLGITPAECTRLKVKGNCTGVPSINTRLDRCNSLIGEPRLTCYENLDKYLMTNVVPWVPYMWSYVTRITSKNVTKYGFDQFATTPAYAHMAVK